MVELKPYKQTQSKSGEITSNLLSYLPQWRRYNRSVIYRHNGLVAQVIWVQSLSGRGFRFYNHLVFLPLGICWDSIQSCITEGGGMFSDTLPHDWRYPADLWAFRRVFPVNPMLYYSKYNPSPSVPLTLKSALRTATRYQERYTIRGMIWSPLYYLWYPDSVVVPNVYTFCFTYAYLGNQRAMNWWMEYYRRIVSEFEKLQPDNTRFRDNYQQLLELKEWVKDGTAKERLEAQAAQTIEELNLGPPEDPSLFS